jgi:hypothetical protein
VLGQRRAAARGSGSTGLARLLGRRRRAGCWAAEVGRGKVELGRGGGKEGRGLVASWASQEKGGMGLFPFSPIFFIFSSFLFLSLLFI